ncbi:MAG: formate dehydrogenase subunit gamma [Candidatus Aminicenantia bacterium]
MKEKDSQKKIEEIIDSEVEKILSDPEMTSLGIDTEEIRQWIKDRLIERLHSSLSLEAEEIKRKLRGKPEPVPKKEEVVESEEMAVRFNKHFLIQHMILFTSVIILILTGLPLKFPDLLGGIISAMGGIETSRILHRVGATGLILVAVYHTFYSLFHKEGRRDLFLLLPRKKDFLDFFQMIKYFLGKADEKPKFGRFNYVEKFDYWAVYWGCVILIGSGLLLWFENISLRYFPKFILDIAKEAHSDEALLAALAIIIWHFYNVHFNPSKFPGTLTWWTGKISKKEMFEDHYLEYQEVFGEKKVNKEEDLNRENEKAN